MIEMLLLASSIVSSGGKLMSGIASKNAAQLNAFNIETEKAAGEAEALQRHNDRLDLYRSNLSANIASFAAQGRDVGADRSVSAFLERQQDIATDDTARSDFMGMMEARKRASQAAAVRAEGRAAMTSAVIEAFTTMAGGLYEYNQVKSPTSSPTRVTVGGSELAPRTSSGAPPVRGQVPSRSLYSRFNDTLFPRG
jgi:uncharacterized protein (DUF885 family)